MITLYTRKYQLQSFADDRDMDVEEYWSSLIASYGSFSDNESWRWIGNGFIVAYRFTINGSRRYAYQQMWNN